MNTWGIKNPLSDEEEGNPYLSKLLPSSKGKLEVGLNCWRCIKKRTQNFGELYELGLSNINITTLLIDRKYFEDYYRRNANKERQRGRENIHYLLNSLK